VLTFNETTESQRLERALHEVQSVLETNSDAAALADLRERLERTLRGRARTFDDEPEAATTPRKTP